MQGQLDEARRRQQQRQQRKQARQNAPMRKLTAQAYDVVLLIDTRERLRRGKKDGQAFAKHLRSLGVHCEVRQLPISDFMWIARVKATGEEVVLNCIVERKVLADLVQSIIDKRLFEQRARLSETRMARVVYLIEGRYNASYGGMSLPEASVESALASLHAVFGYRVQRCADANASMAYLARLHTLLVQECRANGIPGGERKRRAVTTPAASSSSSSSSSAASLLASPLFHHEEQRAALIDDAFYAESYAAFSERLKKGQAQTVAMLFAQQLRVIKGLSPGKIAGILARYPTASALCAAYAACGSKAKEESLLCGIQLNATTPAIGKTLSKTVRTFFCAMIYN
jgi:crossover junction endonuclease MUS81